MIPSLDFPEANKVLTKPPSMTDEQCYDLSVWSGNSQDGFPLCISKWQLNAEELEEIKKTGTIYLIVTGVSQPPVSLHVESPFIKS